MKAALRKLGDYLKSPQARPAEIALARLIAGALAAKLGYDFEQFVH